MYIHIPQDYMPDTRCIQQLVGAHHGAYVAAKYWTHISIVYITTCNMLCTSSHNTVHCNTS